MNFSSPTATAEPGKPGTEAQELRVKGSSLASKLRFVRETFGPEAEEELRAFLTASGVRQVLDGSWYPFKLYDDLLRLLADRHYGGDLSRLTEVGAYSAHSSLKTTYEVYAMRDFFYFLERVSTLHSRFYSLGTLETRVDKEAHRCSLRLLGAPYYSDPDLYVASGFYTGAAQLMGLSEVTCEHRMTGGEVLFDLRWEASVGK